MSTSFQVLTDGVERRCPSSRGQATHKDEPAQPAGTTAGFEDALAQVVRKNLEMNTLPFATANHVVDGQVVPRRPQKDTT